MISNRELALIQMEYEAMQEQLDKEWNEEEYLQSKKDKDGYRKKAMEDTTNEN